MYHKKEFQSYSVYCVKYTSVKKNFGKVTMIEILICSIKFKQVQVIRPQITIGLIFFLMRTCQYYILTSSLSF